MVVARITDFIKTLVKKDTKPKEALDSAETTEEVVVDKISEQEVMIQRQEALYNDLNTKLSENDKVGLINTIGTLKGVLNPKKGNPQGHSRGPGQTRG